MKISHVIYEMKSINKILFFIIFVLIFLNFHSNCYGQTTVTYTSSTTWTAPAGVTSVTVECWGGGGAGGGESASTVFGGGGGAGGAYATKVVSVVPGNNYTVTVGTGGAGGTSAGPTGNPSWFSLVSEVYAQGGAGGSAPNGGTASGGAGSSASSIGTTKYAGGNGANGTASLSGGGGGGAGSTGAGGNASGVTGGTGTTIGGGAGGAGDNTPASESDGIAGNTYGGGGSGAMVSDGTNHSGGNGADGAVKLTYTVATDYLISGGNITTCNGNLYDSGGSTGDYLSSEDYTITITPSTAGSKIRLIFSAFSTESVTYDWLEIYDGPNTASPLLGRWGGTTGPGTITSSDAGGRLTLVWHSDGSVVYPGFAATISCYTPALMSFVSSTVTQPNTTPAVIGSNSNEIICIQVVTTGSLSPLSVSQFTVNANGSTSITDINAANSATIYYTGTSSTFATTTSFGSNTPTIANFTINGSQTLAEGTNYFWLAYNVRATATIGNVIDGECTSLLCGVARTPSTTAPGGNRPLVDQVIIGTGTSTNNWPFYTNYGYSRSASLFTAAEVGIPTLLTSLAWNISTSTTADIPVKIYLKTTTATDLTSDTWANMIAGATLVYNGTTQFTPTGWKTFDITDFSYCSDNLLVLCEANFTGFGAGSTVYFYYTTTSSNSHEYWYADSSPPTGTGTTSTSRPNIKITKTPAVVTIPNCATYTSPANGASGIVCGVNAIMYWTPSITGCNPPTSYDVYFGTAASPPYVTNQTATMYNPGTLLPSTTYYWKIVPRNAAGPAVACATWSFSTGASYSPSQTTPPITDGFETCTDWTIVNGSQPNIWIRGTATAYTGSNSMYIHNGGGTDNDYDIAAASTVHFYKDITFPAGNNDFSLRFYWKGEGESASYDYLRVYFAPTSVTPVAGTQVNSIYALTPYVYNQSSTWEYFNNTLPVACGGNETWRLIFSWYNDVSTGTQPPIAVDDIIVTISSRTGSTCANPVNVTLPYTRTGETTNCMVNDYSNASPSSCGSNYESGYDKVYKVLVGSAGCVNVTLSNCNSSSIGFQVYSGCPDVGGSTCIFNSTSGATGGILTNDLTIPAPGYYYFIVDNWAAPNYVNYDIAISAPGGNTVNDPCSGAIPLTFGIAAAGDNTCTNDFAEPGAPACWTTGVMNTVWYSVVVPVSRDIAIRTTGISLLRTQIAVYTGTCGSLTLAGCNQDAPSCGTSYEHSDLLLLNVASTGSTVYIRVDGEDNLVGSFSILVIDGNNGAPAWPPIVGQDCGPVNTYTNPVCGQTTTINNPGYFAYGNFCDFTGSGICLASGEKSSVWYTININNNGNLNFDIIPNDYGNPNPITGQSNPGYTSYGDETDYDWAIWKWEAACDGTGDGAFCCTEIAAGTTAATSCNYNYLGVTGLSSTGNAPGAYGSGFDDAYEPQIAVTTGEIYVLVISNFANDYVSGYTLQFSGTSPINYATPGATLTWSSSTSNSWAVPGNWGGCSAPACNLNAVVASGGAQPVITSNTSVQNLTINTGATLTINAGVTVTVCGNFTNNGNLVMSPTATLLFNNASVAQSINGSLTGANKIGGLTITKTGSSVTLNNAIDIGGNFTTSNTTSVFNANNQTVKIAGNFNTAAASTITNFSNVEFNGIVTQTYTNNSGTITWNNVIMNNTGGGMTLSGTATSNLVVAGTLTLTNGIIYTSNPPLLIMNAGSICTSGSSLSFVDGPMQKIGNTAFVFPVGDAFNRWMRIGISAPTAASTFQAQYFYTPYSNTTTMAVTPVPVINNVSLLEYWQLNRAAGTGNAQVTLYWENAASSGITSCAALQGGDLVVARWNGSAWENRSNTIVGGITGSCVGSSAGTVTSDVLTAFSPFTFASKSGINPLPVELVSFSGWNNNNENILSWKTISETNNDFFTLEKSRDGYTFVELAKIKAAGNSNSINNYSFTDREPYSEITYYRLKQTDFDGKESYAHNVVALKSEQIVDYVLYPNPAKDKIMIYSTTPNEENITIEIADISGRIILHQTQLKVSGIGNASSINIQDFPEGFYYITILDNNNNNVIQKKFIKAR